MTRPSFSRWITALGVLMAVVGVLSMISLTARDFFDHDGYVLMTDVEKSFSEYSVSMGQFTLPQRIHYWFTYRLLGGQMSDYLVATTAVVGASLLFIFLGTSFFFKGHPYLPFFVSAMAAFNSHTLYLAGYSMFSYAASFLVAVLLFLAFLNLSRDRHSKIAWYWIPIAIIPGALFSNLTITVPVMTGALSAYALRSGTLRAGLDWRSGLAYLKAIWPLAIFPLSYLLIYSAQPLTNMGREKRPDMDPFFFFPDVYGTGIANALTFVVSRTRNLYTELIHPISMETTGWIVVAAIISWCLIKRFGRSFGPPQVVSGSSDDAVRFTFIYVILTTVVIAVAGLLKIYPYGTVRYASYLLFPAILLLGLCVHTVLSGFLALTQRWQTPIVLLVGAVLVASAAQLKLEAYAAYKKSTFNMHSLVKNADAGNADLILMGAYYSPVFKRFRPDLYNSDKVIQIGWGRSWGEPFIGEVELKMKDILEKRAANRVLVVASSLSQFKAAYPTYSELLFSHYDLEREESAMSSIQGVWFGYFRKKGLR